jgi:S-adenosylmethionine uptake transporter
MLFAAFVFTIMGVCIKLASSSYSTAEIVMYRGLVGVLFMATYIAYHRGTFRTALPWQHLWRGIVGVTAMWLWFFSIGKLPLATAMTLNYLSPVWIAAILFVSGLMRGKKRFEWGLVAAVCMSFIGVVLLLRPSIHADQWFAGMVGLLSGLLAAFAYLQVRHLGQLGETESRVVFYFSITGFVSGLLGSLAQGSSSGAGFQIWHAHSGKGIALLLTIGVCATVAQVAMTRAYRLGKTLVTANLQYTGIIFSSAWGVLIWGDTLNRLSWLGIAVIVVSGCTATYYNARDTGAPQGAAPAPETETDPIAAEL